MRALWLHFLPLNEISDPRGGVKLLDDRNQRALEVDQSQPPLMAGYRAIKTPLPVIPIYRETYAGLPLGLAGELDPNKVPGHSCAHQPRVTLISQRDGPIAVIVVRDQRESGAGIGPVDEVT